MSCIYLLFYFLLALVLFDWYKESAGQYGRAMTRCASPLFYSELLTSSRSAADGSCGWCRGLEVMLWAWIRAQI